MAFDEGRRGLLAEDMASLWLERRMGEHGLRPLVVPGVEPDAMEAVWGRTERRAAVDAAEAEAMKKAGLAPKATRKVMFNYDREKPTPERSRNGAFEVVNAAMFDTQRDKEKLLMDWKARAGGAGEMYARQQIARREMMGAAMLMSLYERAQTSALSGFAFQERVDGGEVDISGGRLIGAAAAAGGFMAAMHSMSRMGQFLVQHRVVVGRPMEEIVQLNEVVDRFGSGVVRRRCELATVVLVDGLVTLADSFGIGGA